MKILNAEQLKAWDRYTIDHEPILSIDLMERAAKKCAEWIFSNYHSDIPIHIFCGKGNNGGDGLAIARLLMKKSASVIVYILESGQNGTNDFQINLERLQQSNSRIIFIEKENHKPTIPKDELIMDALFGTGLNRPLDELNSFMVKYINESNCEIISIDMPSGLLSDKSSKGNNIIKATHTLSFQCYKLAFLLAENSKYTGTIHILDIGLHEDFFNSLETKFTFLDRNLVSSKIKKRNAFAHKGNFGHALLFAGSYGKMGAATLSARACLRSGIGLLTCHIPKCGYNIMQISVPEAMVETDIDNNNITKTESDLSAYNALGIGPGIGISVETKDLLTHILLTYRSPIVMDADALNILSFNKELLTKIPPGSILTPHPKEFERLFGNSENDVDRLNLALKKAKEFNLIIILKGHHSFIASINGSGYFNSTGNSGMATAGSGDVLTGIILGLLAQGYTSRDAALSGVYLHGLAGDLALNMESKESLIASDIINSLGKAFKHIN